MWKPIAIAVAALVFCGLAASGPAAAQSAAVQRICTSESSAADAAIAACTRVLSSGRFKGVELAKILSWRAAAYRKKGDYSRSIADLDRAIQISPRDATYLVNRAFARNTLREFDLAIRDLDRAISLNRKNTFAYNNRAWAYVGKGDFDRAIDDANEAIRLDPKNAFAYGNRSDAYRGKGDYDRALADAKSATALGLKEGSERVRLNEQQIASRAASLAAAQSTAEDERACSHRTDSPDVQISACGRVIASGRLTRASMNAAYRNRALAHSKKGYHGLAAADWTQIIQYDPASVDAFVRRSYAYNQIAEYERAIADATEAIRLDPKSAYGYGSRALAHNKKGDYDRAIADAAETIRLDPGLAIGHVNRGYAFNQKGEPDRALRDLDEAVRLAPKEARVYFRRAQAYRAKGDLNLAHNDIAVALALKPGDAEAIQERDTIRRLMAEAEKKEAEKKEAEKKEAEKKEAEKETAAPAPATAHPAAEKVVAAVPPAATSPAAVPPLAEKSIVATAPAATPATVPAPAPAGPRVALVIGNGKYRSVPELANPANDARDIAAALRELGFRVIEGYDLDSAGMREKIGEFGAAMQGAATTLFYYAGHGIQAAGRNYLIPVDAKLQRPSALDVEALRVGTILADMETEKRVNLVFLDACRDNPLSRSLAQAFGAGRSSAVGQGLAQLNAGIGTLITFATSPDRIALDGTGRNSPFTAALLKHIRTPDLEVRSLLTRVRADVIRDTNERQVPWDHSSLTGEFYFRRGG